jgi:dienelactone hydrolase
MRRITVLVASVALGAAAPARAEVPPTAGPDLLRAPAANAPQLSNTGVWRAKPILVSGAVAYRRGELVYQDHLFDDHGAKARFRDYSSPQPNALAIPQGTYTYPSGPDYHGNDADLVELRVRPLKRATAFRVTLNTMVDPKLAGVTLALGSPSSTSREYPHGANVSGPADVFVTVNGARALVSGAEGAAQAVVDRARSQITVTVPHDVWNPRRATATVAAGVGLWDRAKDRYAVPVGARTATQPGGAWGLDRPPAFFNVAFRTDEPTNCCSSTAWRENRQAAELAEHDMSAFTFPVDFGKLARRTTDESRVPRTGMLNRIFASRFTTGTGVDLSVDCDTDLDDCPGQYQTRLQPYALYVPPKAQPPYGLTLLLHANAINHNQYSGSRTQAQLANRGNGSLVFTPLARGADGNYRDAALADVFEVWADVAEHYSVDRRFTAIAGYSMGAGGTYSIAQRWPDLFAGAFVEVGANLERHRVGSLRHVPVIQWQNVVDEYVGPTMPQEDADAMIGAGYRYELDQFPAGEHTTLSINDAAGPAADYLGTRRLDDDPHHVTYVVDPTGDDAAYRLAADHAYWLADVRRRGDGPGTVDAVSHAFGTGDPVPSGRQLGAGVLTGGALPALPYKRQYQTWSPAPAAPVRERLDLKLTNVSAVTVDLDRARLPCSADVRATSDGVATVTLEGRRCRRTIDLR